MPVRRLLLAGVLLGLAACTGTGETGDRAASVPDRGVAERSWVVLVGDSYISGEGARWAGNTTAQPGPVDALGRDAYRDDGGAEAQPGCHRAVGVDVPADDFRTINLACSGARARSFGSGTTFKPGLDFRRGGRGQVGQAAALRAVAAEEPVAAVVVSIGGNDVGFGSLVGGCAAAFLSSTGPCRDDPAVRAAVEPERMEQVQRSIVRALANIDQAMREAGYGPDDWRLLVQTYPSPVPAGGRIRYRETLLERGLLGGCPFYDADATWADRIVVPAINAAVEGAVRDSGLSNVTVVDQADVLDGHQLCERGVGVWDGSRFESWRDDGVADAVEWVNRVYTGDPPWQVQESLHPNHWGVIAQRACVARVLGGADGC